jgi:ribosome recycling factor
VRRVRIHLDLGADIRRGQRRSLPKDKTISEDDERRGLDEVRKMTDAHISKLDAAAKTKEKDILEVK